MTSLIQCSSTLAKLSGLEMASENLFLEWNWIYLYSKKPVEYGIGFSIFASKTQFLLWLESTLNTDSLDKLWSPGLLMIFKFVISISHNHIKKFMVSARVRTRLTWLLNRHFRNHSYLQFLLTCGEKQIYVETWREIWML